MKDYYQILEIRSDASLEQVKEQYRLLAYAWHPDRFTIQDQKVMAEEKLKEINEAYEVLSDLKRRTNYDSERMSSFGYSNANNASHSYLDAARTKTHTPWRYIAGISLILFIWLGIGSVVAAVLIAFFAIIGNVSLQDLTELTLDLTALGTIPYYLTLSVTFIIFFLGIWLTVVLVHRRPLRTLVTGAPHVNWRRIWLGGGIWILLAVAASLVEYLIWPETFSIRFDWRSFVPFFLLAIFLTPIQTTSEELFFRGYLVQGSSLISRNAIFLSLLSGLLFTLPHLANPEVAAGLVLVSLNYFVLGVFLTWISLKDGTLELALGIHAGNNLFAALAVTFPDSALPSPAIFYTTHFDPTFGLVVQVVACVLFYLVVFGRRKRPIPTMETSTTAD